MAFLTVLLVKIIYKYMCRFLSGIVAFGLSWCPICTCYVVLIYIYGNFWGEMDRGQMSFCKFLGCNHKRQVNPNPLWVLPWPPPKKKNKLIAIQNSFKDSKYQKGRFLSWHCCHLISCECFCRKKFWNFWGIRFPNPPPPSHYDYDSICALFSAEKFLWYIWICAVIIAQFSQIRLAPNHLTILSLHFQHSFYIQRFH